jgi:hypothetical protein
MEGNPSVIEKAGGIVFIILVILFIIFLFAGLTEVSIVIGFILVAIVLTLAMISKDSDE